MDADVYRWIWFIILSICLIPSAACFLLIFVCLFKRREINDHRLNNHVILVLLGCNFVLITTELPITLAYSYHGHVQPRNEQFCLFWIAFNYGISVVGLYLMAFASVERYFLIFHEHFIRRWRFIVHYPPIVFCLFYPLLFYNLVIGLYPCEPVFDYDAYVCGGACFQFATLIGTIDYMVHVFSPTTIILLANIVLLVRVTYQKRSMKQANTWQKCRLMYVQLVSIGLLYFIIWIPFVTVSLIRLFYDPLFLQDIILLLLNYSLYICPLASPFISLIGLPTVRRQLTGIYWNFRHRHRRQHNQIRPMTITAMLTVPRPMPPMLHEEHRV